MGTRNVNLTDHFDRFVEEQIASGHFKNASEVMRAGLRLLEQCDRVEQEKLAALRKLATEGFSELDQGQGLVLNGDDGLAEFIRRTGRRVAVDFEGSQRGASKGRAARAKNSKSSKVSGARRSAKKQ